MLTSDTKRRKGQERASKRAPRETRNKPEECGYCGGCVEDQPCPSSQGGAK